MSDPVEIPASIVVQIVSFALTLGVTWGMFRGRIKSNEDQIKTLNEDSAKHGQSINILDKQAGTFEVRIQNVEALKTASVSAREFDQRMDAQDKRLEDIGRALNTKASVGNMRRVDPREERSDPPLPPMRPRVPTQR